MFIENTTLGISRGPNIKWLAQLISSNNWGERLLGPVPAKAKLGELFDGRAYQLIKSTKPELAFSLYHLGLVLESSIRELARPKRYIGHFAWQAEFMLFSLCVKAFQSAGVDFHREGEFLEFAHPVRKWLKFCKQGIDRIRSVYLKDAKKYRKKEGQELALANYFKSQSYTGRILGLPVPQEMKKLAKELSRSSSTAGTRKRYKDPGKVAAAKKAWVNMRAKRSTHAK